MAFSLHRLTCGKRIKIFKTCPNHSVQSERFCVSFLPLSSQKVQTLPPSSTWPPFSSAFFSRAVTAPGKDWKQGAKIQLISVDTGGRHVQPLSSAVSLRNYQPLTFHQLRDLDGSSHRSCLTATQAVLQGSLSEGVLGAAAALNSSAGCDCKAV